MSETMSIEGTTPMRERRLARLVSMLWRDKVAFVAAVFLLVVLVCAVLGPWLFGAPATRMNLRMRNAPPLSLQDSWLFVLGADSLGRSLLARVIVASQATIAVSVGAVLCSMVVGTTLGLLAGFSRGWVGTVILRLADVLMSFPSLLLAMVVLYMLQPSVQNVVLVLAITRVPVYLRTVRAETLEIRERMFVLAARALGAGRRRLILRHVLPVVLPTVITVATLDFAFIMLAESSLSFLGLGIQPPAVSWGLMVADGRNYLASAWWLSFWPGLAIMLTTTALNTLSNWTRIVTDPQQRWRLEGAAADSVTADDGDAP